jgi:NADH-quinone oxidoreductase subunit J
MGVTQILFWFLSAMAIGSAIMVITAKNPVHSVLYLIVTFFAISGHYILMNAQFLAVVNIIVYAGAIMVLFLFVVMFMQFAGIIAGGCLFLVLTAALNKAGNVNSAVQLNGGDQGLIKNLGNALFKDFVLPFEISSVLFLSAMIGAVVIGKKEQ